MSEQKSQSDVPIDELEDEPGYVNFASQGEVEKALKQAFAEYDWPKTNAVTTDKREWMRPRKKGAVRKKITNVSQLVSLKFNYERVVTILALTARAFPMEQVAEIAGVSTTLISKWMARGKIEGKGPYWVFSRAMAQLFNNYEAQLQGVAHKFTFKSIASGHAPTEAEAKMALSLLASRFPKRWGNKVDVTSGGEKLPADGKKTRMTVRILAPGPDGKPVAVAPTAEQQGRYNVLTSDDE